MIVIRVLVILLLIWGAAGCIQEDEGQPVANAGPDKVVDASKSNVELRGDASFDPNGDSLVYHWSIEAMPAGSNAILSSFTGQNVRLTVDEFGIYEIGLIVDDGITASNKDIVRIDYRNEKANTENLQPTSADDQNQTLAVHIGIEGKSCIECHSRPVTHIASTDVCDACHASSTWVPVIKVDHSQINGACRNCHNGLNATGKAVNHITSTDECGACHTTLVFIPAIVVDHTQVLGSCNACHNGTLAIGKTPSHINTSDRCEACHTVQTWSPVVKVDHNEVVGICLECHNGVVASGKSTLHIPSSDSCGECHSAFAWLPLLANAVGGVGGAGSVAGTGVPPVSTPTVNADGSSTPFDHTDITDNCVSCHSGIRDLSIGPLHRLPGSAICEACHTTQAWAPIIVVNHAVMVGPCIQCHNNTIAAGKPVSHLASTDACSSCHSTTTFIPTKVDHSQVLGSCESCHFSPSLHVTLGVKTGCDNCHSTLTWINPVNPLPTPIVNNGG